MNSEALILFFIAGVIMVGAGMLAADLLAPKTKNAVKEEA